MATVLVTAGPTREHLDEVRFLSNGSTGRMGHAVAAAARDRGHRVLLVSGPTALAAPAGVAVHPVVAALDMLAACRALLAQADLVFGVAAVADHRPAARAAGKPARGGGPQVLTLVENPDIIADLAAASRGSARVLVGFALEALGSEGMIAAIERGRRKLAAKALDLIAVNLADSLAADRSQVTLLYRDGRQEALPLQTKAETAERLVGVAEELWERKR
jgi:phosphopantothenoylcysteine decarboxylase/phosphopantothenate--cysteine ligase